MIVWTKAKTLSHLIVITPMFPSPYCRDCRGMHTGIDVYAVVLFNISTIGCEDNLFQLILIIHEACSWVLTLETVMAYMHGDFVDDGVLNTTHV